MINGKCECYDEKKAITAQDIKRCTGCMQLILPHHKHPYHYMNDHYHSWCVIEHLIGKLDIAIVIIEDLASLLDSNSNGEEDAIKNAFNFSAKNKSGRI